MVRIETNIDCMKRYIRNVKASEHMQVGDCVDVPITKGKLARLKVIERYWDEKGTLSIYLGISCVYANIPDLEVWLKNCLWIEHCAWLTRSMREQKFNAMKPIDKRWFVTRFKEQFNLA